MPFLQFKGTKYEQNEIFKTLSVLMIYLQVAQGLIERCFQNYMQICVEYMPTLGFN